MTHRELMQYANVFFMAIKLDPNEIEAHITREEASLLVPEFAREAGLRIQAYRNVLTAQQANSMAAIADIVVSP